MSLRRRSGSILGFLLLLIAASSTAEEKTGVYLDEPTQMGLGDRFFQEGDYYRAITEYKRFLFLFPQSPRAPESQLNVVKSYFQGKRWDDVIRAAEEFERIFPASPFLAEAVMLKGIAFGEKGDFSQARLFLGRVQEMVPQTALADEAQWQIALTYLKQENWKEAAREFRKLRPESKLYPRGEYLAGGLDRIETMPEKSPQAAGILAALMPGAGHVYVGRYRDAAIAFLLNGAFIWGIVESFQHDNYALGALLTFFELGWYGGNIYSAVSSAFKYNRKIRQDYLDSLEKGGVSVSFSFRERTPFFALRYTF
jgi:tetratricopeptide (TPR) repeat protein